MTREPWFDAPDAETLARALYETDSGSNGYPPLHESIPWRELTFRESYFQRAEEIRKAANSQPRADARDAGAGS